MSKMRDNKGRSLLKCINDYTVIDLETTGLSINDCEIIEMSAVKVRDNKIVDEYTTLVKPAYEIPDTITELTGITNELVADAPSIIEVLPDFIDFIGDDIVLGHNINSFDVNIIYDHAEDMGIAFTNDLVDTLYFARCCDLDLPDHKQATLCKYFNVTNSHAHRSLYDCEACHEIYQHLKPLFDATKAHTGYSESVHTVKLSDEAKSIRALQDIIKQIISSELTDQHVYDIKDWLEDHSEYADNYPFCEINTMISDILEDDIILREELKELYKLFEIVLDPVALRASTDLDSIPLKGKRICVTGDFEYGARSAVKELLTSCGATVTGSVSGKTDYLIVGEYGSADWKCGNYGSKAQKAFELQSKGSPIKIIGEHDFFKKAGDLNV